MVAILEMNAMTYIVHNKTTHHTGTTFESEFDAWEAVTVGIMAFEIYNNQHHDLIVIGAEISESGYWSDKNMPATKFEEYFSEEQ